MSALTIAEILVMWVLLSLLAALFFGALVDLGRDDWDD